MAVKQLPNKKWQARWRDAHNHTRAKTFRLKADAIAHHNAMVTERDSGLNPSPTAGKITLAAWADQWLAGAMNLSQGTTETYRRDLDRYILPTLGEVRLRSLTSEAIEALLAQELEAKIAPSSVHRHYRTIRRCLEVATERNIIGRNPCTPITPPRIPRTEMRFLTAEQVELLATEISDRYRAWVLVAAYTGIRWSEAVGLRRRDIDLDGGRLTIVEQLVRRADKTWDRTAPKTRAGRRVISLSPSITSDLTHHVDRWALPGADGLVFANQYGRPLNGPSFRGSVFAPACAKAGLADTVWATRGDTTSSKPPRPAGARQRYTGAPRPHDLRHTAAALMVLAGAHPKAMQVRMGHSSIMVTLDRYGHLFPEMDTELAQALDELRPGPGLRIVA
jgi:integrase